MSMRHQAGIVLPGYNALKVANAPTIGTATAGNTQVSVTFTAPSCVGGGAISSYTVFANCGIKTASGGSSPLVVTGLTNCTAYTFKVIATNAYGPSYPSAASNSATPQIVQGQQAYTTAGTYSWVAPSGVTSVAVVAVGGGGSGYYGAGRGGGGGGLGYKNNYSVTPGNSYTVVVGAGGASGNTIWATGGNSYFVSVCVVKGGGTGSGAGTYTGDGGGNGGAYAGGGGGGAGGYAGNGGAGSTSSGANGSAGSGGGAGGGGSGENCCAGWGGAGGGVGILGQGSNGSGGVSSGYSPSNTSPAGGGNGGSSGCAGGNSAPSYAGTGGTYGGGGGGKQGSNGSGAGGGGAVRIIWPGTTRSFPSTNTGNL